MRKYRQQQQDLHDALEKILLEDGEIISCWCVCYEAVSGGHAHFGYVHGPRGTLPWRARGMHSQVLAYMDAEAIGVEMMGDFDEEPPEDDTQ